MLIVYVFDLMGGEGVPWLSYLKTCSGVGFYIIQNDSHLQM